MIFNKILGAQQVFGLIMDTGLQTLQLRACIHYQTILRVLIGLGSRHIARDTGLKRYV